MDTNKLVKSILWVLMGVSVLFTLLYIFGSIGEGLYISWAYVLLAVCTLSATLFPLAKLFSDMRALKRFAFVIVGFAALVGISYAAASDVNNLGLSFDNEYNNPSTLKLVGTGIYMIYILLAVAVGSIFFSAISKRFR